MRFHHVGFVVTSIQKTATSFAQSVGATWSGDIVHDPLQVVRVTFLEPQNPTLPTIELVEPVGETSTVAGFLQRGGGLHHLCYEVEDLDRQLKWSRSNGDLVARLPMAAAAFGGRRISWVYTKNKLLLEYLEQ
jgi:methylmalonyl-CoA/ethylmalonyl-CoA epimerase